MKTKKNISLLALGAESAGNFSVYHKGKLYLSNDFGDLLVEKNFERFKKKLFQYIRIHKIKPDIIITDLHPLYKTTLLGGRLSRKFKAKHIKVQHHIAHIFSAIGDKNISNFNFQPFDFDQGRLSIFQSPVASRQSPVTHFLSPVSFGLACDGTGYGFDGKIWGGEIFKIKNKKSKIKNKFTIQDLESRIKIERVGHLEEQVMIGGDLAIREPARMIISILNKCQMSNVKCQNKSKIQISKSKKNFIYSFVKRYYTKNQFELLYNQLEQNFNCQETSSAGRVLDAVSILLGFCGNKRNYKHEPIDLLEKNSTIPYFLNPKINPPKSPFCKGGQRRILLTTPLFEYLIRNISKDKKRLAATAQIYIAKGLWKVIKLQATGDRRQDIYLAGGMGNNKIISSYLENRGVYLSKKIPRSDAGISFGQIIYYLLNL